MADSTLLRMDNVGIVVESLDKAIAFFEEIGLTLQGRGKVEGEWSGLVTGVPNQVVEIAMMVTPDGHSKLELCKYIYPEPHNDHRKAPVNSFGYLRVMFAVTNVVELVERLKNHGAALVGEIVNYENMYKLCYIRGVEGILIGLAEPLNGGEE